MARQGERVDGLVRLALTGTAVVVVLFLLSQVIPDASEFKELKNYLNMDREGNLPTAWSAGLLLGTALLALLSARGEPKAVARSWTAVAVAFGLLSLDEATQLHERLARVTLALDLPVPTNAWVLPGVVVLAVGATLVLFFARDLPRRVARGLLVAAACFFLGALGVEALFFATAKDAGSAVVTGFVLLEEALELMGATLAFCVVGRHFRGRLVAPASPASSDSATTARMPASATTARMPDAGRSEDPSSGASSPEQRVG